MAADKLTKRQQELYYEVEALAGLFGVDYPDILDYDRDTRLSVLYGMKNKLVRGQVVLWYTLVDEFLNAEIRIFYFGRKRTEEQLMRTKRYKLFAHYILESMYLISKVEMVSQIKKMPSQIKKDILALNNVRNGLAHSFMAEKRRTNKPVWKGKDIISYQGAELFREDMSRITTYFIGVGLDDFTPTEDEPTE